MDRWPPNSPPSLENICLDYIVENIFKFVDKTDESYCLKPGICLPQGISDAFLSKLILQTKLLQDPDHNLFGIFNNRASTVLKELNLRYSAVNAEHLKFLCLHPIQEIDISYCGHVIFNSYISAINQAARTLRSLRVGGCVQFQKLVYLLNSELAYDYDTPPLDRGDSSDLDYRKSVFQLPNLRSLFFRDIKFSTQEMQCAQPVKFLHLIVQPLKHLTHLDLCECQFIKETLEGIGDLELPCLVSLGLCDVLNGCVSALDNLCRLTKLRQLDVSQGDDARVFVPVQYPKPSERLSNIVTSMPNLTSLDISGTNLAGFALIQPVSHRPDVKCANSYGTAARACDKQDDCIAGLEGRQFEFLGLLDCSDDASHRKHLPARKVTGDVDEQQVLTSVHAYRDRPNLLTRAFNNLFQLFRHSEVKDQCSALEGILYGMERNKHSRHVQISGSASLFYLVKGDQKHRITQTQKMKICSCLLEAMERHLTEHTMMRNGCLTLCHFNIPNEVMFCYDRLVKIILGMLKGDFDDDFLQRIGIFLLNSLACQVEGKHKQALGDLGTIEVMCDVIKQRLERQVCDEILEVSWSTLWNVTDETPTNCERFMDEEGMYLFLGCFKEFPEKEELLRNMMGLMGNIAEVAELRPSLMIPEYVTVFSDFLESTKDGIEVSYNAAGVVAHMLSDGLDGWTVGEPSRDQVIDRMVYAIQRWPLNSKRNINYRSFVPILKLVRCFESHASQYWAIWALCNLTQVYPDKYCKLLQDEGGIELLDVVTRDPRPIDPIKLLASQVIGFVQNGNTQPQKPDEFVEIAQEEINDAIDAIDHVDGEDSDVEDDRDDDDDDMY